jgi:GntR family transcriptional regulator
MSTAAQKPLVTIADMDLSLSTPLYQQLADVLRKKITEGTIGSGDALPTEQSLSKALGLGISTVRSSYALLVEEGLITRRRGRGTFVSEPRLDRHLASLYNFSTEIRSLGKVPSSKILCFLTEPTEAFVAEALGIDVSESVYKIARVRLADGVPLLLETSYVPVRLCPGLTREDMETSLYKRMEKAMGAMLVSAVETHEAVTLRKREAHELKRPVGMGAFKITRTTTNSRGERCEYSLSIAPGDQISYTIELGIKGTAVSKSFLASDRRGSGFLPARA